MRVGYELTGHARADACANAREQRRARDRRGGAGRPARGEDKTADAGGSGAASAWGQLVWGRDGQRAGPARAAREDGSREGGGRSAYAGPADTATTLSRLTCSGSAGGSSAAICGDEG